MTRTAPSCIIFLLALLTATLWLLGLIPVASPCPMPLCWLSTAGSSTLLMRQTPCRLSGPTSFSLATSVTNSNHRLGEMLQDCAPRSSSHLRPQVESEVSIFPRISTQMPDSMSISPALAFCRSHFPAMALLGSQMRCSSRRLCLQFVLSHSAFRGWCDSVSTLANVSLFRFPRSDFWLCCDFWCHYWPCYRRKS